MRQVAINTEAVDQFSIWGLNGSTKISGLSSGDFNVFIYKEAEQQIGFPFSISEIDSLGEYKFAFTPDALGFWRAEVYYSSNNNGQHWVGDYDVTIDSFDNLYLMLKRALGLLHENSLIDMVVPDPSGSGQAISARLRIYDTKANAEAAKATSPAGGTTGLLETYTITATYNGIILETYTFVREP